MRSATRPDDPEPAGSSSVVLGTPSPGPLGFSALGQRQDQKTRRRRIITTSPLSLGRNGARVGTPNATYRVWEPLPPSSALSSAPALQALNSFAAYTKGGDANWVPDADFAHSGAISDDQWSWMQIQVQGRGTVRFQWKVSSQSGDGISFDVDGWPQYWITGEHGWQSATYVITTTGTHALKWRYIKDSSGSSGQDRGWVKAVTWQPTPSLAQALDSPED